MINKILIANRGEIARRIIRTAKKMQISTVAIYANDEEDGAWISEATESYSLGEGALTDTYLNAIRIIEAAKLTGCDAIHPGYGFLSENSNFAKTCFEHNIIFIGPKQELIELMGDKLASREFAQNIGVPVSKSLIGSPEEIVAKANDFPLPAIIKASAGGGGKGMQIVYDTKDLLNKLEQASSEAEKWFGNGTVYLEQFFENPRHIEVQVLADEFGNAIHLFERECSIQRKYQKIIEEAPSLSLTPEQRREITNAAIKLVKEANYTNAGTIEFLWDKGNFYFLEMNTRIQVEHTVSEEITGIDIVEQQILISNKQELGIKQQDISIKGHSIETRIYAEDPLKDFKPSAGYIHNLKEPVAEDIRLEATYNKPTEVSVSYDGLIAKVISTGVNRDDAISKMQEALSNYVIHGVNHNTAYLKNILANSNYLNNNISTRFIDNNIEQISLDAAKQKAKINFDDIAAAYLIHFELDSDSQSVWSIKNASTKPLFIELLIDDQPFDEMVQFSKSEINFLNKDFSIKKSNINKNKSTYSFVSNGNVIKADISRCNSYYWVQIEGEIFKLKSNLELNYAFVAKKNNNRNADGNFQVQSPLHGKISELLVSIGDSVKQGQELLSIESMKTENIITSPRTGIVDNILIEVNNPVKEEQLLITFKN